MRQGYVRKIGGFEVGRRPMGSPFGAVTLSSPPKGGGHTTEGLTEIPPYGDDAPQLTIGRNGIYQHRGFGTIAGTLRHPSGTPPTNGVVRIQFELVGFSSVAPWLPASAKQREMLAAVFEFAQKELDVPAKHVWPDDFADTPLQSGQIWASENNPRRGSKFPGVPGWYIHAEVPNNSHWDMGSCRISKLMDAADEPKWVEAFALIAIDSLDGHRTTEEVSPFFSKRAAVFDWMIKKDDDGDAKLRLKVRKALVENRIRVAERRVRPDDVTA